MIIKGDLGTQSDGVSGSQTEDLVHEMAIYM